MWRCANVNAVERLGLSDHGEVHNRIVANASLRMLRLLRDAGFPASVTVNYRLLPEEAEVVVVLAAALHDLGITVHYDNHTAFSLPLARLKAKELLAGLYGVRDQTILISEVLHAIASHHGQTRCLTLEAGILKLADALDMTAGRVRPLNTTQAVTSNDSPVTEVLIKKGMEKPIRVEMRLNNVSGDQHLEEAVILRLQGSPLFTLVEVVTEPAGVSNLELA
jgi:metal-dependent HD superfamily phosphatase/phosphodiesterase